MQFVFQFLPHLILLFQLSHFFLGRIHTTPKKLERRKKKLPVILENLGQGNHIMTIHTKT